MLVVDRAKEKDLPQLVALYTELSSDNAWGDLSAAAERLKAFHAIAGSGLFVGFLGKALVSTCALAIIPNLTRGGRPYGLVENVVTAQAMRGRGFGKQILRHALDQAWKQDCYKVMLMTGSQKPQIHAFYQSLGFEATKTGYQIRQLAPRAE